ncbi:MAG: type II toxin-antitoxin system Phd/YefM family antitoxin [Mycobacteriales bacterium]
MDLVRDLVHPVRMDVGTHEAKTRFSELLRRVAAGEEVTIRRGSEPVARLVPIKATRPRRLGMDVGTVTVPEDFDAPLTAELLQTFES